MISYVFAAKLRNGSRKKAKKNSVEISADTGGVMTPCIPALPASEKNIVSFKLLAIFIVVFHASERK